MHKLPAPEILLARPHRADKLLKVDGRRRETIMVQRLRAELVKHAGGEAGLSVTQSLLIDSICQLKVRLLALDRAFAATGRMTEADSRHYRGWTDLYHSALRELGLSAAPAPVASLIVPSGPAAMPYGATPFPVQRRPAATESEETD